MRGAMSFPMFKAWRVFPLRALPVISVSISVPDHPSDVADSQANARTGRDEIVRRHGKNGIPLHGFQKVVLLPELPYGLFLAFGNHFGVPHINDDVRIAMNDVFKSNLRIGNGCVLENVCASRKIDQLVQVASAADG